MLYILCEGNAKDYLNRYLKSLDPQDAKYVLKNAEFSDVNESYLTFKDQDCFDPFYTFFKEETETDSICIFDTRENKLSKFRNTIGIGQGTRPKRIKA